MKTVEVIVEHAGKNLSAYIEDAPVITVGNDMREIEDNMREAIELYLEDNFHDYISYTKKQHMLVIIMIVVVFLFMIYGTYNYIQNHWIATIVYETAVEGTYPPDAE